VAGVCELRLKNVYKSYQTATQSITVLRGFNLEVQAGEFVAIIGQSGQGKSTLLNILGCLDRPDSGEYWLRGERVNWNSPDDLAKLRGSRVATVFQNFELIPHWTVLENVEMPLKFQGVRKADRSLRALQALRKVGLLHENQKFPHQLSGGQQQRVAIARALCAEPDILLADEPTGNLDPQTAAQVVELIMTLNHQGMTVIMVTHDHSLAQLAHRVGVLQNGQLEWWSIGNDPGQLT
jgi:putative ABC transport system ATP-binding protein